MTEFKDKIPAGGARVAYFYKDNGVVATEVSGFIRAVYTVAVSMDGKELLAEVPMSGLGQRVVSPQPSVLTYVQADAHGMWGRSCPVCQKYFRTDHVFGITFCPYCAEPAPGLAYLSKDQATYVRACYEAFARAMIHKKSIALEAVNFTDDKVAWHYSEEKLQLHFKCETEKCGVQTDILGEYGYCPRCCQTTARKWFAEKMNELGTRLETTDKTVPKTERRARGEVWEDLTTKSVSALEALANHLRIKLLRIPMTTKRRKEVENLSFQRILQANRNLNEWFGIGFLEWPGNDSSPKRIIPEGESPFITKMVGKRHLLTHNSGVVDQEYLDFTGDDSVRLGERIKISSSEARHFVNLVQKMGMNLLDNVEYGFDERVPL